MPLTEEEIMEYANIIPAELQKELAKATKDRYADRKQKVMNEQIRPIVEEYVASLRNPQLPHDKEQILWNHTVTKGVFKKEIVERWIITDKRAVRAIPRGEHHVRPGVQALDMDSKVVGLAVCDTVVMNQRRISKGNRIGTFVGSGGGGGFVGTSVGSSSSTSSTYGDLVFFVNGKEVFRFLGISDPHGVRRMVETIKKQECARYHHQLPS
jgi:hypothetical protein